MNDPGGNTVSEKVDEVSIRMKELEERNAVLEKRIAELELSEERFRTLFEASNNAHLIFDEATNGIIDCNGEAIRMLRCESKERLLNIHPAVLSPEYQPDGRRSLEKCIEMDATARKNGYHRFEWTHRRLNGEDFPVEVTLTPVKLHSGPAILVVWHELTDIKHAEAELLKKMAIIEEQARQIQSLSTPILEVWDKVLLVPLLGVLDATRADQLSNALLQHIVTRQATYIIVDSTGIASVDEEVARRLIGIIDAVRLLGAKGVIVGIRRDVATSLVETGVDISRITTLPNVYAAISAYIRAQRS
jgi:PAS domain S-box-containing protein